MRKFRKKPVVIQAHQFNGLEDAKQIIKAAGEKADPRCAIQVEQTIDPNGKLLPCLIIDTLEGEMRADLGWWVIIGVEGEVYPCKPSVFDQTYELDAEEASQ